MNIAIAGYGVEGQANYAYWSKDPANAITIVDEKLDSQIADLPKGVATLTGEGVFGRLQGFDLVVRTAGLAPHKIHTNGKVWSATNEFFARCTVPIIGVTGSKGKGTTASLIASILEASGKKVWLVGNIGVPALGVLSQIQPDDIVVYELSSFQLWDLQRSPKVAVVLFIEQEHLDVHTDMAEYVEAKAQITRHQTKDDLLVYNAQNEYANWIGQSSAATKVSYPSDQYAHVQDGVFYYAQQPLCSVGELRIPGGHNIDNALAAIDAVWPYTQSPDVIKQGLNAFRGLPHRLAFVAEVNGVRYYDDSIATTPTSAIAGLRAFGDVPKVVILGGSYKGSDFTELAAEMPKHQVKAILMGDEAKTLADAFDKVGYDDYEILQAPTDPKQSIAQLFTARAAQLASPGGVVLLSPAAASFGLFKNYADRGDQFIAAVKNL